MAFSCAHSPEPAEKEEKPRQVDQEQAPKLSSLKNQIIRKNQIANLKPRDLKTTRARIRREVIFKTENGFTTKCQARHITSLCCVASSKGEFLQKTQAYHGWDINLDGELDMFEGIE